jgi:hypothetical protein
MKGGRIVEYGTSHEHRVWWRNGVIRAWNVARERDRRGNTTDYIYQTEENQGTDAGTTREQVISRIRYTGHVDGNGNQDVAPTQEVEQLHLGCSWPAWWI